MKALIETASPQYLKRLVRALNAEALTGNGFYASVGTFSVRCIRARFKAGVIECKSPSCSPEWFTPARNSFSNCNGAELTASRR